MSRHTKAGRRASFREHLRYAQQSLEDYHWRAFWQRSREEAQVLDVQQGTAP